MFISFGNTLRSYSNTRKKVKNIIFARPNSPTLNGVGSVAAVLYIIHHVVGFYRWSKKCYFEFLIVLFNPFWYYCTLFPCYSTVVPIIAHFYHVTTHVDCTICHFHHVIQHFWRVIQQLGLVIQRLFC
jgi:hypothetical protein